MRQLKRFGSVVAALCIAAGSIAVGPAVLMAVSTATAMAIPPGVDPSLVPFSPLLRRCDYSVRQYVSAAGDGWPTAHIRTESNEVVGDVELAAAKPNSFYEVRLIQVPLPSSAGCHAGSVGTAVGSINTNGIGAGAVTLRVPVRPGATGAWIAIERPQPNSLVPDEFYSSDKIVDI